MSSDDQLKYLFFSAFEHAAPGDDCPEPDTLVSALRSQLPLDARAAVIDHVAACPTCAEAWRLAVLGGLGEEP